MLLVGGGLGLVSDLASWVPILGFFAVILLLGYMIATYFEIIQSTSTGSNEAPEFPEFSNVIEDLVYPIIQVIFVGLLSFLPWLVWIFLLGGKEDLIGDALIYFGMAYFPMAMMAVVVLGEMRAANPFVVIPAIVRAGGFYWLAVGSLVLLYLFEILVAGFFGGIFILGTVVIAFIGMYTLMANGRILGLIYREKEEELGWL